MSLFLMGLLVYAAPAVVSAEVFFLVVGRKPNRIRFGVTMLRLLLVNITAAMIGMVARGDHLVEMVTQLHDARYVAKFFLAYLFISLAVPTVLGLLLTCGIRASIPGWFVLMRLESRSEGPESG